MNFDRTLSIDAITETVQQIEPSWNVVSATAAEHGHHIVYFLDLETEDGDRKAVLKATPDEKSPVCGKEARLQAILAAHTSIPVPGVYGVVDEHGSLPAPFLLQSRLEGANYRGDIIRKLSTSDVERLARSTGRYLADLHSVDAVDGFGVVDVESTEILTGQRPSSDLDQVGVEDATDSWVTYVDDSAPQLVAALADTRFADERRRIEPVAATCAENLVGEFEPVIARIDNAIDNLLLNPETYEVTGMLDWEFCVAATPAYDLTFVIDSRVNGFWSLLPNAPDGGKPHRRIFRRGTMKLGHRGLSSSSTSTRNVTTSSQTPTRCSTSTAGSTSSVLRMNNATTPPSSSVLASVDTPEY